VLFINYIRGEFQVNTSDEYDWPNLDETSAYAAGYPIGPNFTK
jgi:hypothetical protein